MPIFGLLPELVLLNFLLRILISNLYLWFKALAKANLLKSCFFSHRKTCWSETAPPFGNATESQLIRLSSLAARWSSFPAWSLLKVRNTWIVAGTYLFSSVFQLITPYSKSRSVSVSYRYLRLDCRWAQADVVGAAGDVLLREFFGYCSVIQQWTHLDSWGLHSVEFSWISWELVEIFRSEHISVNVPSARNTRVGIAQWSSRLLVFITCWNWYSLKWMLQSREFAVTSKPTRHTRSHAARCSLPFGNLIN